MISVSSSVSLTRSPLAGASASTNAMAVAAAADAAFAAAAEARIAAAAAAASCADRMHAACMRDGALLPLAAVAAADALVARGA